MRSSLDGGCALLDAKMSAAGFQVLDFSGEVSRGEKMLYSGTDPESYNTKHTLLYKEK